MKLLFFNIWQGIVKLQLDDFIKEQLIDTDIFCFQEATANKNKEDWLFKDLLKDYNFFSDFKKNDNKNEFYQSTFIAKKFEVKTVKTLFKDEPNIGFCLYTSFQFENKIFNVCNVHGVSNPGDKLDTPARLKQSKIIIDFLKNINGPKIIGGDFNLEYDVQSVKMFEENGYRNLIKDYKITTTRNETSWKKYPNNKQYFADFVFVSPDIKVLNFSVPNNEVSDHLPQILEIE